MCPWCQVRGAAAIAAAVANAPATFSVASPTAGDVVAMLGAMVAQLAPTLANDDQYAFWSSSSTYLKVINCRTKATAAWAACVLAGPGVQYAAQASSVSAFGSSNLVTLSLDGTVLATAATAFVPSAQTWFTAPAGWQADDVTYTVSTAASVAGSVAGAVRAEDEECSDACTVNAFGPRAVAEAGMIIRASLSDASGAAGHTFPTTGVAATDAQLEATVQTLVQALEDMGDRSTAPGVAYATTSGDTSVQVLNCLYNPGLGACIAAGPNQLLVTYIAAALQSPRAGNWYAVDGDEPDWSMVLTLAGANLGRWAPGTGAASAQGLYTLPSTVTLYNTSSVAEHALGVVTAWSDADAPCASGCIASSFAYRTGMAAAPAMAAAAATAGGVGSTQNWAKVKTMTAALYDVYVAT